MDVLSDPMMQLVYWVEEAAEAGLVDPDAMALATATRDGLPSVRTVLFRGLSDGFPRFFTNERSRKGRELEGNPEAALLFLWTALHRQVRIEGRVEHLDAAESDAYFRSRPRGSQLGAWASPQSDVIASLDGVRARCAELDREHAGRDVPRPPWWGGYRLVPRVVEFWRAGADRLHDRLRYTRSDDGRWIVDRLAP